MSSDVHLPSGVPLCGTLMLSGPVGRTGSAVDHIRTIIDVQSSTPRHCATNISGCDNVGWSCGRSCTGNAELSASIATKQELALSVVTSRQKSCIVGGTVTSSFRFTNSWQSSLHRPFYCHRGIYADQPHTTVHARKCTWKMAIKTREGERERET